MWDLSYSGARSVVLWSLLGPLSTLSNEQSSQIQTSLVLWFMGRVVFLTMRNQLREEMMFLNV